MGRRIGSPPVKLRGAMSQYEVAEELGVSRARIMQIEAAALAKLRAALEALGVDGPGEDPPDHWSDGEDEGGGAE